MLDLELRGVSVRRGLSLLTLRPRRMPDMLSHVFGALNGRGAGAEFLLAERALVLALKASDAEQIFPEIAVAAGCPFVRSDGIAKVVLYGMDMHRRAAPRLLHLLHETPIAPLALSVRDTTVTLLAREGEIERIVRLILDTFILM